MEDINENHSHRWQLDARSKIMHCSYIEIGAKYEIKNELIEIGDQILIQWLKYILEQKMI
jgi:hypothetical protein